MFRYAVSPDYFRDTMSIPLRAGRLLNERDNARADPGRCLISDSFAKRKFPGLRLRSDSVCALVLA